MDARIAHGHLGTIYVEYANTGDAAMPAPILQLRSADPDGSDRPIFTLNETLLQEGFWTGTLPRNVHSFGLIGRSVADGALTFFEFDGTGSTAGITDAVGEVVNRYAYAPFGNALLSTGGFSSPFEFVGQFGVQHDGNGLQFMRSRYLNTAVGRFVQSDPLGIDGGDVNFAR